jgi:hypothetical protein
MDACDELARPPRKARSKGDVDGLLDEELVAVRVTLRAADVVFVKGIFEASEGLGSLFAEPRGSAREERGAGGRRDGGAVVIAAPKSRSRELAEVLKDLSAELEFMVPENVARVLAEDEPIL